MACHLRSALSHVKTRRSTCLPLDVDQLAVDVGHDWRERLLSPAVTVRLFFLQILNGNVAITALRQIGQMTATASSYCEARARCAAGWTW
jgi:hypothetical protein